jgi:hypothetical protein
MAKINFTWRRGIYYTLIVGMFMAVSLVLIFRGHRDESSLQERIPKFLKIETDYYIYDALAGHIHKANAIREYIWPEHKKGKIIMKTNNLGFREDVETREEKPEGLVRILVTGDSQTDGVVYNSESFSNHLEYLLNRQVQNNRYECINGGVGHYGPQHYSGFLKRFLYLKPDVYVVVFYTGNDFLDTFYIEDVNGRLQTPMRPAGYHNKLLEADKVLTGSIAQSLNQIFFFKTFPGLMEKAIEITMTHMEIINQVCRDHNIKLLVVLLPTKLDIELHTDRERIIAASKVMELSEKDFGITRELINMLISCLHDNNINYLDLFSYMKRKNRKLYWKKDHHLNCRGHRMVARVIYNSFYQSLFTYALFKERNRDYLE